MVNAWVIQSTLGLLAASGDSRNNVDLHGPGGCFAQSFHLAQPSDSLFQLGMLGTPKRQSVTVSVNCCFWFLDPLRIYFAP